MKHFYTIILISIFLGFSNSLLAQEFDFIEPNGTYYFSKKPNSTKSFPKAYGIEIIGHSGNNQILIPYSSPQTYNTTEEDIYVANPNTSWIGDQVIVSELKHTTIINQYNKSLYFKSLEGSTTWDMFVEEDGARIEASFTNIDQEEILEGITDAVATITLSVFDSLGNPWNEHQFNNLQVKISESFGVIELFPINRFVGLYEQNEFYSNATIYTLIGFEQGNDKQGWEYNFNPVVARVEVGTEIHYDYEDNYLHNQKGIFNFEVKRKIMTKTFDDNTVTYGIKSCIHQYNSSFDSIYYIDYNETYQFDAKLNQSMFSTDENDWNGYLIIVRCNENGFFEGRPDYIYGVYNKTGDIVSDNKNLWILSPDYGYSMGTSATHTFVDGLGDFITYRGESNQSDRIVYYKTPTQEHGTPFEFECSDASSIDEFRLQSLKILPNPAEDVIEINWGVEQSFSLSIFNLQGKEVVKQVGFSNTSKASLDISQLDSGVYFVRIHDSMERVITKKLIKK